MEPAVLQQAQASADGEQRKLWDHARGWRNLVFTASVLTTAALALSLMPEPMQPAAPIASLHPVQSVAPAPVYHAAAPLNAQLAAPQELASATPQPAAHPASTNAVPGLRELPSGVLTPINTHNRHLMGQEFPVTITIITPPAHGHVTTQVVNEPFRSFSGDVQVRPVTKVFYQSDPGYTGQDGFTYKRTSEDPTDPWNPNTYNIRFNVK